MKLNIYENKEIIKTYTADEYDIMFGTIEDLAGLIDADAFESDVSEKDFIKMAASMISGGMEQVKNILKDVFPGLSDSEIKHTKIKEIIPIMMELIKVSIKEIKLIGENKKK